MADVFFFLILGITDSLNLMSLKQEEILANWVGKINVIQDISFKNKSSSQLLRILKMFGCFYWKTRQNIDMKMLFCGEDASETIRKTGRCCLLRLCASLQAGHVGMRAAETVGRLSRRPDETRQ